MPDFSELQAEHQRLLHQLDEKSEPAQLVAAVQAYVARARSQSAAIRAPRDRDQLRANLRFWGAFLFDRTGEYPDTTLRPAEGGPVTVPVGVPSTPPDAGATDDPLATQPSLNPPMAPEANRSRSGCTLLAIAAVGLAIAGVLVVLVLAGPVLSYTFGQRATALVSSTPLATLSGSSPTPPPVSASSTARPAGTLTPDTVATQLMSVQETQSAIQASVATATATNTPNLTATAAACTYDYQLSGQQPEDGKTVVVNLKTTKVLTLTNTGLCAFQPGTVISETTINSGFTPISFMVPTAAPQATAVVSFDWPGRKTVGTLSRSFVMLDPKLAPIGQPLNFTLKYVLGATPFPVTTIPLSPEPTGTPAPAPTTAPPYQRLQMLAQVSQQAGPDGCANRSLAISVPNGEGLTREQLAGAQVQLSVPGGDVIASQPLNLDRNTLDLTQLGAGGDNTLLLRIDHPKLTFASVIVQYRPDCSRNQTTVTYQAQVAPSYVAAEPPHDPGLDLIWQLVTWGPDPREPKRWVAELQLAGQGGDGQFIFWDGETYSRNATLLFAQSGCEPGRRLVGVSSGGQAVLREIVLQAPVC